MVNNNVFCLLIGGAVEKILSEIEWQLAVAQGMFVGTHRLSLVVIGMEAKNLVWWWECGFDVGCRREWTRGSREVVRAAENQVISGNCLIGRLL